MLLFSILSSFAVSAVAPWVARRTGKRGGWLLALLPAGLAVYFGLALARLDETGPLVERLAWAPQLGIDLSLRADGLGLLFALIITGIGALVVVYAGGYLDQAQRGSFFYAWLMIFMASMIGVALSDNLLVMYVFWELTSFSSFMLIGFEHDKPEARQAALQALLVTGGGGLALLAGLVLLGQTAGTFEISAILAAGSAIQASPNYLPILVLMLLGAFTKSAQFPFHFWLPGAMQAPTPVSAYLHSATMVKAGVFLLARFYPILSGTAVWQMTLMAVGLATMLVGAFLALKHSDLKLMLAYATVGALGSMVFLLGMSTEGAVTAAMVLLVAHAMYKGALFMIAGSIQHETGTRDVTRLGGLWRWMPYTALAGGLAALSMAGFGPVFGFVGKELLLETLLHYEEYQIFLVAAVVLVGAVNVAVALLITLKPFWGKRTPDMPQPHHTVPLSLWLGPALLAVLGGLTALFASPTGYRVISPAVSAILGQSYRASIYLWHGLTPALGLSAISIGLGTVFYLAWPSWHRLMSAHPGWFNYGPQWAYEQFFAGLNRLARFQTRILQSGYLRYYLLIILLAVLGLVGYALLYLSNVHWPTQLTSVRFYEGALGLLILLATVVIVRSRSRLGAVAALGVVGYSIALIFLLYGAPDLAMTQFLIESLTVILFVLAFYHLPHFSQLSNTRSKSVHAFISICVGALMSLLVLSASGITFYPKISQYFMENSYTLAHGKDVVNVILVDFRGIDTLGEITVLAIAAIGVFALLKLRKEGVLPAVQVYDIPDQIQEPAGEPQEEVQ